MTLAIPASELDPATPHCQSCSRPMESVDDHGTLADGSPSQEYCGCCLARGEWVEPTVTPRELIDRCVAIWVESRYGGEAEVRTYFEALFPTLDRWRSPAAGARSPAPAPPRSGRRGASMRSPAVTMVIALLLLLLPVDPGFADPQAPGIDPADLAARRAAGTAPVVIDVRTPEEYAAGHIPGALNIAFDRVAERIGEVDAPHGVALYCMVGPRARKGEAALLAAGYTAVLHLEGGLAAWQAAGLPVESTR